MIGKWCIFCRSHKLCTHNKSNHKVGFSFFLYTPCTYTPLESLLQLFCVSQTFLLFQCCRLKLESRVSTQHILNSKTIGMITEKEFPLLLFFFYLNTSVIVFRRSIWACQGELQYYNFYFIYSGSHTNNTHKLHWKQWGN